MKAIAARLSNLRQLILSFASGSVDMKRIWIMIAYSNREIVINNMHTMHHTSRYEMADTSGVLARTLPNVTMNIRSIVTRRDTLPGISSGGM